MKNNEDLQKKVTKVAENGIVSKVSKHLKMFIYLIGFAGIALCFNSCMAGYVASEPAYVENIRPLQPSPLHIWIDGGWLFNRQSHMYVQKVGYWEKPVQGRSYVSGHWQKTQHGSYWVSGRWQRQGHGETQRQ